LVRLRRAIYAPPRSGDNLNVIFAPQEHPSATTTTVSVTCGSSSPGWHSQCWVMNASRAA
jgi:hypothetical protein